MIYSHHYIAGGKRVSNLDLSTTYQQLPLDKNSMKYLTINTRRGLYPYTHLPFGVALAPVLFRRVGDTVLQGVPRVLCYIDSILVLGEDDADHMRNLEEVLPRLHQHGFI